MRFWTEDKIRLLKELDAAGMSAGEIAKAIGAPSRSSVLGKLFRLANPTYNPKRKGEPRSPVSATRRHGKPYEPPRPEPLDDDIDADEAVTPFAPNHSTGIPHAVLNRHPRQCRYPIGNPDEAGFHFCGKERDRASSYCVEHRAMCCVPLSTRDWFEERREWAYANPEHKLAKRILKRLAERAA